MTQSERPYSRLSHPGRLYEGYTSWRDGDDLAQARVLYVRKHGKEPEEILWTKPGMWQAGPVPEPVYAVGDGLPGSIATGGDGAGVTELVSGRPGASQPEPEIETTPAIEQPRLF